LKPKIIAVVGGKKVGKTTTTENLIAELTKRGYKVAAIKHISEPEWTIDTPGKDTYRFAQHGAKTIIVVGKDELVTIEKGSTEEIPISALLSKAKGYDIVLTEGFKKTVAKKTSIPKIAVVTNKEEAEASQENYKPILAFSGPYNSQNPKIPYINGLTEPQKLADLVESKILKNKKLP
jgi:molybdopterin-guanine dinucleotide biosynthesis adapter protein